MPGQASRERFFERHEEIEDNYNVKELTSAKAVLRGF